MGSLPSKTQINKAGRLLRRERQGRHTPSQAEHDKALAVLRQFRTAHSTPLVKANNGLRSMIVTAGVSGRPTQRLKRIETIIDKLVRIPTMALANMQDIGGCRVVCPDLSELDRLAQRVRQIRPPCFEKDYILNPKPSGYRGLHLVITYDERLIEIQLRTEMMHLWARAQEKLGDRLGVDLKSGCGPEPVLDLMKLVSIALAIEENGSSVDQALAGEIERARQAALPYINPLSER